ncbi:MAG: hypothetical protein OEL83_14655 [Desulforhopalus sp.]|nr:hypothetical protein [Desulforhopalus sp.]
MKKMVIGLALLTFIASPALAAERTWLNDVQPIINAKCVSCHGPGQPEYNEWRLLSEEKQKTVAPRMDTYPHFMSFVLWPATGAVMRRLDNVKPGNMYEYLGENEAARAANLTIIKEWLGEGAWNQNRWKARGDVPGITKEQLESIKAKY